MGRPRGSKNKPKEEVQPKTEAVNEPQNVGDEPKSAAPPHYKNRLSLINEISSTNKERQAAEEGENQSVELHEEVDEESELQEEQQEVENEIESAPEKEEESKVEPTKHKFILDGKEVEMTDEEVRVHVQKSATADTRMREAAKMIEDARRLASPTQDRQRSASHLPDDPSSPDAGNGPDKQTVQRLTQALMYGNEEEVAKAVEVVLGGGRQASQVTRDLPTQTQGMTPQQIAAYVDEKLAFENAKRLLETPKDQGGLSDIYTDPVLQKLFHQKDNELLDQGDKRPYVERYKAIGEEIRKWKDEFVQKNTLTGLEERDSLKRTTGVVRGAGAKAPAAPLATRSKTQEEIISDMRKSRGLN